VGGNLDTTERAYVCLTSSGMRDKDQEVGGVGGYECMSVSATLMVRGGMTGIDVLVSFSSFVSSGAA
jgi:hypothetical protein